MFNQRRKGRRQRGAELVEFAVTLPTILIIAFIMIEFAVALNNQAVLTNASRAAALAEIRGGDGEAAAQQVYTALINWFGGAPPPDDPPQIVRGAGCGAAPDPGCAITVTVTQDFSFQLLPDFLGRFVGLGDLQLAGQTTMYEQKF